MRRFGSRPGVRLSALVDLQNQPLKGIFLSGHQQFPVQYHFSRTHQPLYLKLHTNYRLRGPLVSLFLSPDSLSLHPPPSSRTPPELDTCAGPPSLPSPASRRRSPRRRPSLELPDAARTPHPRRAARAPRAARPRAPRCGFLSGGRCRAGALRRARPARSCGGGRPLLHLPHLPCGASAAPGPPTESGGGESGAPVGNPARQRGIRRRIFALPAPAAAPWLPW
jgi:hypothetical protein